VDSDLDRAPIGLLASDPVHVDHELLPVDTHNLPLLALVTPSSNDHLIQYPIKIKKSCLRQERRQQASIDIPDRDRTNSTILRAQVLVQRSRHDDAADVGRGIEMTLAALSPRRRHGWIELHLLVLLCVVLSGFRVWGGIDWRVGNKDASSVSTEGKFWFKSRTFIFHLSCLLFVIVPYPIAVSRAPSDCGHSVSEAGDPGHKVLECARRI